MATELHLSPPRTLDPLDAPALRWGVLAPGGIARTFTEALRAATASRVVAVGSRDLARAQRFVDGYATGATAYGSYDDLGGEPDIDVVYVGSPHSEHRDLALLAIAAGKHVLVEKAFTRNAIEAREVFDAARAAGVLCMEAMWSRFLPHFDVVRRAVEENLVGELPWIAADHGQCLYSDGPTRLASPSLAGGALLDLGVYPVSFAAMLLPRIDTVDATGLLTPAASTCRRTSTLCAPDDVLAALTTTMADQTPNTAVVAGTRARLELDGWFYVPTVVRLVSHDGEVLDTSIPPDSAHALQFEAAEAARCIAAGRRESPLRPHAETLRVMGLLDEVRDRLGVRHPSE